MLPKNRNLAFKFTDKRQFSTLKKWFKILLDEESYVNWLSWLDSNFKNNNFNRLDGVWFYFNSETSNKNNYGYDKIYLNPTERYPEMKYIIIDKKYLRKFKLDRINNI